jgi:hypothetical protein
LDHVVHINNGSGAAKPIVLRLLPGEETIFNLKVVNHGEPSNISLQASSPVFKAVRLRKPDHYIVMEEIIPIMARMPSNRKRLDGEILLSGSSGECRVPIILLRDSEDPGDDLEDPGLQGDEELKEEEDDSDDQDEDGDEDEEKETEKEPRRIAFSSDQDLQRYRSATRHRKASGIEDHDSGSVPRFNARIDDRFVDPGNEGNDDRKRASFSHEEYDQGYPDSGGQEIITSTRREERTPDEPDEYVEQDEGPHQFEFPDKLGGFGAFGALKAIPAALFLALVVVLVLTFITQSIPEYPGALVSSTLIVTLIIYGAATLLKA